MQLRLRYRDHRLRPASRPMEFLFLKALVPKCKATLVPGRVEDWRGDPLGSGLVCIRGFPVRARVDLTVTPFPAPSTSNAAGGFPALRSPVHFAPKFIGPILLATLSSLVTNGPYTHRRVQARDTTNVYSTSSNRNHVAAGLWRRVCGSSFQPTCG